MSKVFVKKIGGAREEVKANTVADLDAGDFTVMVNSEVINDDSTKLNDGDFVILSKKVKGNADHKIITKTSNMLIKQSGGYTYVNGAKLTNKQAENMAEKILTARGWKIK